MGTIRILRLIGLKPHIEAFKEVAVIAIISLAPIAFGALVRWALKLEESDKAIAYFDAIDDLLKHGELFMCALAFVAVIAWHVFKEWPAGMQPPRITLGIFCLISFALVVVFYTLEANHIVVRVGVILTASKGLLLLALVLYYFSTVLTKCEGPGYAEALAESAGGLSSELRRRKSR